MSLISIEKLSVKYGSNTVLRAVDLEISSGEIVTIVGPNGSGKTSLLKAIIGAVQPADGVVKLKPKLKIGGHPKPQETTMKPESVSKIIWDRALPTIILMSSSIIFGAVFGILIGVYAATKPYSLRDNVSMVIALFLYL